MKKMKKIFALLIAMVMVMGMSTTVFAAADGSITIQNTVKDKEYNVYKVFDATYSGDNVAYTYDGSNATFLAALQGESSPFTTTANTASTYNVVRKADVTDEAILTFIKGQAGNFGSAVKTLTGNGATQTATGLGYGYYYITTTTGTNVTIDSALKDVTVIDKNEVIPPPDKTESTGTYTDVSAATAKVGDTVDYKVTGTITRYVGETLVTNLYFSDTMTSGLTPGAVTDIVVKDSDGNIVDFKDGLLPIENGIVTAKVNKVDIADGKALSGAKLQILDKDGKVVEEWVSDGKAHEIKGLNSGETYTLHEVTAPDGYTVAQDETFSIDENGEVTYSGTMAEDGTLLLKDKKVTEDEKTSSKDSGSYDNTGTGDNSHTVLWTTILLMACAALLLTVKRVKKT